MLALFALRVCYAVPCAPCTCRCPELQSIVNTAQHHRMTHANALLCVLLQENVSSAAPSGVTATADTNGNTGGSKATSGGKKKKRSNSRKRKNGH